MVCSTAVPKGAPAGQSELQQLCNPLSELPLALLQERLESKAAECAESKMMKMEVGSRVMLEALTALQ